MSVTQNSRCVVGEYQSEDRTVLIWMDIIVLVVVNCKFTAASLYCYELRQPHCYELRQPQCYELRQPHHYELRPQQCYELTQPHYELSPGPAAAR